MHIYTFISVRENAGILESYFKNVASVKYLGHL